MGLVLSQLKPGPRWETLDLGEEVRIGVEITPPTYAQITADRCMVDEVMANLNRLECVTNWHSVLRQTADGGTVDVPFSREALAEVFVARPRSFLQLLKLLAPLFAEPAKKPASGGDERLAAAGALYQHLALVGELARGLNIPAEWLMSADAAVVANLWTIHKEVLKHADARH